MNEVLKIQTEGEKNHRAISVKTMLDKVLQGLQPICAAQSVRIVNKISAAVRVVGNDEYLINIFSNLITNCIKYQSPERTLEIHLSVPYENNKTVLAFKDNGIGIDLKKHKRTMFGMLKTFNSENESKGVGLFINKSQMEAMNGSITVESEVGQGTIFKLHFPRLN